MFVCYFAFVCLFVCLDELCSEYLPCLLLQLTLFNMKVQLNDLLPQINKDGWLNVVEFKLSFEIRILNIFCVFFLIIFFYFNFFHHPFSFDLYTSFLSSSSQGFLFFSSLFYCLNFSFHLIPYIFSFF